MLRVWLFAMGVIHAASFRTRKTKTAHISVRQEPTPAPTSVCQNVDNFTVGGHDFSNVMQVVCNFWPDKYGDFPFTSPDDVKDMLQLALKPGALWDKFKEYAKDQNSKNFCYRKRVMREVIQKKSKSCPPVVTESVRAELTSDANESIVKTFSEGRWSCNEAGTQNECTCTRRDVPPVASRSTWIKAQISSRPEGCQMVHRNECYGSCPDGYKPVWLVGNFRPVCNTICASSDFPFKCGAGCAKSRRDCWAVLWSQTKSVLKSVSRVVSYVTKVPALEKAVDAVISLMEFTVVVLKSIADTAMNIWMKLKREQMNLGLVVTLFQIFSEESVTLIGDGEKFKALASQAMVLMLDVSDTQLGWGEMDLTWMANVFLGHGQGIVESGFNLIKDFVYTHCDISVDKVVFTIESAGDDRIVGTWQEKGTNDGRPRYVADLHDNVILEWGSRRKSWNIWIKDRSTWRGRWFGWIGFGWKVLYENRGNAEKFIPQNWEARDGDEPAPLLLAVEDDGVAIPED